MGFGMASTTTRIFGGAAMISVGEAPLIGGRASAGVPASMGAFAGLRTPPPRRAGSLEFDLLLPPRPTVQLGTDAGASFGIGGRAEFTSAASLRAGAAGAVGGRISFGG
jgi:hypothetical protein